MASFTDQLIAFNPYVQQLPVDDYARIGIIKQDQYNQGVQKVQSFIDSISGIEVVKAEHKDYLNKRVNQLRGEVSKIVSRDFSNQQLVTSVGNLSSKIASDPIIQNAETSTKRYKEGISMMKKAQQEGKSSPSNEWVYQKQVVDWLKDGDIESSFNGEYTPFTDVNSKVLKVIKDLDPNSTLEQIPYKRGANGEILMDASGKPIIDMAIMEKSVKGVTPERIEAAIRANLDANDMRQLQIDGRYNYRNYDKTALKQMTDDSYTNRLDRINSAIQGLLVDRQTNINDKAHVSYVDNQINLLKERAEKYRTDYGADVDNINKDPEGYKAAAHMQSWITQFGDGFAYSQNSLRYENNPYFQGAMKQKELDLSYSKFAWDQKMDVAKLSLEEERIAIERMKAEAEKAKKLKGAESPFIPLSDPIREPIDQKALEQINKSSFLKETDDMTATVDDQKMALVAQIRPDLVHVVRTPDGLSRHYEYNVAGKDPNAVKTEAEATILKIKDSYDRDPNSVDDASRTYFDNLGTAALRVQNRKTAVNKLQNDVTRDVGDITPLLRNVKPISVGGATFNAQQQVDFNNKLESITRYERDEKGVTSPVYDNAAAARLFVSPAEKRLFQIATTTYNFTLSPEERAIKESIDNVRKNVNQPAKRVVAKREEYLNNGVRDIVSATEPVSFTVEAFKAEDRKRIQAVTSRLFNTIVAEDKESPNPRYDKGNISEMLTGKNSDNTTYALRSKGGDTYSLTLSNTTVTNKPVEIDVTKAQANDLFGQGAFLDEFQAIREALQLSKGSGRVTTDVQGTGKESAFTLRSPEITQYGVKYHVEDPLKTGGLQIRAYIYDKSAKQWTEKPIQFGRLLNEAQVMRALGSLTDREIKNILGK